MGPELQTRLTALVKTNILDEEEALEEAEKILREHQGNRGNNEDMTISNDLLRVVSQRKSALKTSRDFLNEVKESGPTEVVEIGADISLLFDGSPDQILLMKTPYELPDRTVITPKTPFAIAIHGMRAGERISYTANDNTHQVVITSVS